MNATKILILLSTLFVGGCGAPVEQPTSELSNAPQRPRLDAGQRLVFAVDWTVDGQAGAEGALPRDLSIRSDIHLAGDLELRTIRRSEGGVLVEARWLRLDEHSLRVMGRDVLPDARPLLDSRAWVLVPDDGDLRRVFFAPSAPLFYRQIWRGLLAQIDLRRGPATRDAWRQQGASGLGVATYDYVRNGEEVTRRLVGYRRVDALPGTPAGEWKVEGKGVVVDDEDGTPRRMDTEELLVLPADAGDGPRFRSQSRFRLERIAAERLVAEPGPALSSLEESDLQEPADDSEAEVALAQQFAEGLTATDLAVNVLSVGEHGQRPPPGFLIRARGFLIGWPERAWDLAPLYANATTDATRALVLDLLASAGTPEAQAVIVEALQSESLADEARYPELLQHVMFVTEPDVAVVELVMRAHAEGGPRTRQSSLYVLGTFARQLAAIDPALSERLLSTLRTDYDAVQGDAMRVAVLAGLGNAGRAEDLARIRALRGAESASVRLQVASALRLLSGPDVDNDLFVLLADDNRRVASKALSSLTATDDDGTRWTRLLAAVLVGQHNPALASELVTVLSSRADDPEAGAAILALAERTDDQRLRHRVRRMTGA